MDRLNRQDINEQMETFLAEVRLPDIQISDDIIKILGDLNKIEKIRTLHPLELSEYSVLLASYALYLASQENKLLAWSKWCEDNLQFIVGKQLQNAYGYGYQEKAIFIRSNDKNATEIDSLRLLAEAKLNRVRNLSKQLNLLSDTVRNLAFAKGKYGN